MPRPTAERPQIDHLTRLLRITDRMMRRGDERRVSRLLGGLHSADIAALLGAQPDDAIVPLFRRIPSPHAQAAVMAHADPRIQKTLLDALDRWQTINLLRHIDTDDAADILSLLEESEAEFILSELRVLRAKSDVEQLLAYPPNTAGGIMTPEFIALREEETDAAAIQRLKGQATKESLHYLYVVDREGLLKGIVSLRDLLISPDNVRIGDLMNPEVIRVPVEADQEEVARIVSRYDLLAVPVVDGSGKMLGVVTVDDVIDVIRQEVTEDFLRMAGTDEYDIWETRTLARARIRLPFLLAPVAGYFLISLILRRFEDLIAQTAVLAAYVPMITGMGGNVGQQTATIVVRGLATGRLHISRAFDVLWREMKVVGVLAVGIGSVLGTLAELQGASAPLSMGLAVGLGMTASMAAAALIGAMVPFLFHRLGFDPAIASGPLVSNLIDLVGITLYFGLSLALIGADFP